LGVRLARGAFWSLAGSAISRGLTLVSAILVARILGREAFGQLGIIQSTVGMFGVVAGFGLGLTANKHVAEFRTKDPARAGRVMALAALFAVLIGGATSGVLALLARWVAVRTIAAPQLTGLLRIGAIYLWLSAVNGAQAGALAGFEAFRAIATRSLWAGLVTLPLMVGGAWLVGLPGAVWGMVGGMAMNCLLNELALRREASVAGVPVSYRECLRERPLLWQFSLPAFLSGSLVGPVLWGADALLVNRPHGYDQLGLFNAADAFRSAVLVIGSVIGTPLLPIMAHEKGGGGERLGRVNMLATWAVGAIPALLLCSAPELVQMAYGKQFTGAAFRHTFVLVILSSAIMSYRQGIGRVLWARGLMWWSLVTNAQWGLTFLAATYFLVRYGAPGLALANLIGYTINTIIFVPLYTSLQLIPRSTLASPEAGLIWIVLLAVAAMALVDWPLSVRLATLPVGSFLLIVAFRRILVERPAPLSAPAEEGTTPGD
jgi:O-antigen/teichoic acid export membrane protein